jgi:hypothetical protein
MAGQLDADWLFAAGNQGFSSSGFLQSQFTFRFLE